MNSPSNDLIIGMCILALRALGTSHPLTQSEAAVCFSAIKARLNGEFNSCVLVPCGPLTDDSITDCLYILKKATND